MLALLEITAKQRWLNKYVKEMIGVREVEDKIRAEVEKRYDMVEEKDKWFLKRWHGKYKGKKKAIATKYDNWMLFNKPKMRGVLKYFMRIGPYETLTNERLSKVYGRYMGSGMTDPLIKYIKTQFGKLSGVQPP